MAGASQKCLPSGLRRGWFTNWKGRREFFTHRGKHKEVLALANDLQAQHNRVRIGVDPPPKSSDTPRTFDEVCAEYLEWGRASGGRNGHPWGTKHAQKRAFHLDYWQGELGLSMLTDLDGCLSRVEKALRDLVCAPKRKGDAPRKPTGKTLQNYAEALHAFIAWSIQHGYMDADPLAGLVEFDATPQQTRRSLTAAEAQALLATIDTAGSAYARFARRRRMGYAVAITTGLRVLELQSLRAKHLDTTRGGLKLEAAWTKNRRDGWQPLPRVLVDALAAAAKGIGANDPLVFVARETSNALERDLVRAGLTKWGPGGRADFHALRHTFVTMLHAAGATFEEVRLLARHAPRGLTDKTYLHVRPERLHDLAEAVGRMVLPEAAAVAEAVRTGTDDAPIMPETGETCARSVHEARARTGAASATAESVSRLAKARDESLRGFKSLPAHHFRLRQARLFSRTKHDKPRQYRGLCW
ncbi:MAG: tyrosine-type recombinase/integrase [Planctomycetota bacterium]|nr:tyrosine-type recombinase/integrase [Planctomycetota bacterium]